MPRSLVDTTIPVIERVHIHENERCHHCTNPITSQNLAFSTFDLNRELSEINCNYCAKQHHTCHTCRATAAQLVFCACSSCRSNSYTRPRLCPNCVTHCSACNRVLYKGHAHELFENPDTCTGNSKQYCPECYSNLPSCSSCGNRHYNNTIRDGERYCNTCLLNKFPFEIDQTRVTSYNFRPVYPIIKYPNEVNPVLYGLEIELNFPSSDNSIVFKPTNKHLKNIHIWKHDGSITNHLYPYGAELIVAPHSMLKLREVPFKELFAEYKTIGVTGYDSSLCGIHIHCSNNALMPSKAFNLRHWMYNNRNFLYAFSKRGGENRYTKIPSPNSSDWDGDKYVALNSLHEHTWEVRLYRSTIDYSRFLATLLFNDAMITFASTYSGMVLKRPGLASFMEYVCANKQYTFLERFINDKHADFLRR